MIKRKGDKLYVKRKVCDNSFNSWIHKKILLYKISYFPEPAYSKNEIKVELDLPNYATKTDLKNAMGVDKSDFAKKADLTSLK